MTVFYSIYAFAAEYEDEWGRSFTATSTLETSSQKRNIILDPNHC